jgi:hypothetical protein
MAKLPTSVTTPKTVQSIYDAYRKKRGEWRRPHLGASQIGKDCDRALWYMWRWCTEPQFPGRILRLFDTGQREEARIVADLRAIGVEVHDETPEGKQYQVKDLGGHFGGSMDGAGLGFPEAPKSWHVLEFKTSNTRGFKELQKKGVKEAKGEHHAQMMVYMHLTGMRRAYYLCVCKETDEIYGERVHYDKVEAERLTERARRIIEAPQPLVKISQSPAFYKCKWCDHQDLCHGGSEAPLPEVNCRTCVHSTAVIDDEVDSRWTCALWDKDLTLTEQRAGCSRHVYIPDLVPWEIEDADPENNTIRYVGGIANGDDGDDSITLKVKREA